MKRPRDKGKTTTPMGLSSAHQELIYLLARIVVEDFMDNGQAVRPEEGTGKKGRSL